MVSVSMPYPFVSLSVIVTFAFIFTSCLSLSTPSFHFLQTQPFICPPGLVSFIISLCLVIEPDDMEEIDANCFAIKYSNYF